MRFDALNRLNKLHKELGLPGRVQQTAQGAFILAQPLAGNETDAAEALRRLAQPKEGKSVTRELYVEGHSEETGLFDTDGQLPPFVVFDADQQMNIAGPFDTRAEAEEHHRHILAGGKPKMDSKKLSDWLQRIDEAK